MGRPPIAPLITLLLLSSACAKDRDFSTADGTLEGAAPPDSEPPGSSSGVVNAAPPNSEAAEDEPGGDVDCRNVACSGPLVCDGRTGACVECTDSSQCPDPDSARCETNPNATVPFVCGACLSNRDCLGRPGIGALCREADGVCVECLTNAECNGNANASACSAQGTCAACNLDAECSLIAERTTCLPGQGCVECADSTDCVGNARGAVCKTVNIGEAVGDLPTNTCVECASNADCPSSDASHCLNNQCVPCSGDVECSHVDSTPDAAGGTPLNVCDAGTCVQCTGSGREACGANVCDSLTRQCTAFPAGSAGLCDPCLSDAHCEEDTRCVQQTLETNVLGFFCFPLATGTPATCDTLSFVAATASATIDTPSADVCLLREAACPSFLAYASGVPCDDVEDDDTCGGSTNGAACESGPAGFRCTVTCTTRVDCAGGDCLSGLCQL